MECGEGNGRNDPVLVVVCAVDQDDDDCHYEVQQQQAPAFADMDQHFAQVLLDEEASDDKGQYQEKDTHGDPDGGRHGRESQEDMRQHILPVPVPRQIKDQEQKIVGAGDPKQAYQPFPDAKGPHGDQREQYQEDKGHGGDIQKGNYTSPYPDVKY